MAMAIVGDQKTSVSLKDIATTLIEFAFHKLKNLKANKKELENAAKLLKGAQFERYEERWTTRLASFHESKAENVLNSMAKRYGWKEDVVPDLKETIMNELHDKQAETFFRVVKGGVNMFYIYYVVMTKVDDIIYLGVAHGNVEFQLSPMFKDKYEQKSIFYFFSQMAKVGTIAEERRFSFEEQHVLHKYFQRNAIERFMQETPHNPIEIPIEALEESHVHIQI